MPVEPRLQGLYNTLLNIRDSNLNELQSAGMQPSDALMAENYMPKTRVVPSVPQPNWISRMLEKAGLRGVYNQQPLDTGFNPSMVANSAKETLLGKFISPTGATLYGSPEEQSLNLKQIASAEDLAGHAVNLPGGQGFQDFLAKSPKSFGVFKDGAGNLYSKIYLPLAEGLEHDMPYEQNPLASLLRQTMDVNRKVTYAKALKSLMQYKDPLTGENIIKNIANSAPGSSDAADLENEIGLNPFINKKGSGWLKGKAVPNSVANFLKESFTHQASNQSNDILRALQGVGNISRRMMLLNFLYHQGHNLVLNSLLSGIPISDVLHNTFGGEANPLNIFRGVDKQAIADSVGGLRLGQQSDLAALEHDLTQGGGTFQNLEKINPNPNIFQKILHGVNANSKNLVEAADMQSRIGVFNHFIKLGYSDAEAAQKVSKYLFNYSNRSPFEKNVLSNIFPFYEWMKGNVGLWGKTQMTHPWVLPALTAAENTVNEQDSGHQMGLNPQYEQDKMMMPFKVGGKNVFLNPMLPFKDWQQFTANPLSMLEGRINPAIGTALDLMKNQNYFGQPITNPNLPNSMQTVNVGGLKLPPAIAYALSNTITPLQPLISPLKSQPKGLLGLTAGALGTPMSVLPQNEKALQQYYAQRNMMDAMALAQEKAGNLTYSQAHAYNMSPKSQEFMQYLQTKVYNLEDRLYGKHYVKGIPVMGHGINALKHSASTNAYNLANKNYAIQRDIRLTHDFSKIFQRLSNDYIQNQSKSQAKYEVKKLFAKPGNSNVKDFFAVDKAKRDAMLKDILPSRDLAKLRQMEKTYTVR